MGQAQGETALSLLQCHRGRRRGQCSALSAGQGGAFAMIFANKKHFSTATVGALVTVSIIALVLSLVKIDDVTLPPTVKYGMVFDAGSSHTSLFVYEWDSDKENNTGVVSQAFSCNAQGQGISSYANDPPKAGDSLRACLEKALKVIPAAKQRDVPVYLGATAGMRLLRQKNSSAADQVLAEVAKTMQEYPVVFRGAQILTGEEEGAYGWITINYLLDSFTKFSPRARAWVHPEAANIYGALDLGGASTQISFMPESSVRNWSEASKFTLYGYNYNIYTHSYLCYGQNEMLKRLAKELIVESASSPRVDHPCYPRDYNETLSLSSFSSSPCTNHSDPRLGLSDRNVTLEGRGNATGCLAAIKKLFNFSACGQSQDCTFDGVSQPPIHGHFIAEHPNSPSLAPEQSCSSPGIISVASSGLASEAPCPSYVGGSRTGHSSPGLLCLLLQLQVSQPDRGAVTGHCQGDHRAVLHKKLGRPTLKSILSDCPNTAPTPTTSSHSSSMPTSSTRPAGTRSSSR
ncbi:ectonucleoside triphosphate diphosphohydrolase 8-like isoform X5 [Apus apus]|uniref:ectonucleoside triphosphate diphosphohydrolase 8-like isoform X5 n=1 Tax=Apus apus TaxID=8895 RepID=UPI0021F827EC|nr:ectonucleoside triphosphate diphosphohydrolase 8-like isoform X5 [Apus apus]XP_051492484.1 ectonucleoside triphosphate diphosphohydrolase 8-like isoform X5 [Apus apus]XP_051492485.1 ectonucleoside triphosphate diphosphohydrolase 8-like isoform X5 [Apus apus]